MRALKFCGVGGGGGGGATVVGKGKTDREEGERRSKGADQVGENIIIGRET